MGSFVGVQEKSFFFDPLSSVIYNQDHNDGWKEGLLIRDNGRDVEGVRLRGTDRESGTSNNVNNIGDNVTSSNQGTYSYSGRDIGGEDDSRGLDVSPRWWHHDHDESRHKRTTGPTWYTEDSRRYSVLVDHTKHRTYYIDKNERVKGVGEIKKMVDSLIDFVKMKWVVTGSERSSEILGGIRDPKNGPTI